MNLGFISKKAREELNSGYKFYEEAIAYKDEGETGMYQYLLNIAAQKVSIIEALIKIMDEAVKKYGTEENENKHNIYKDMWKCSHEIMLEDYDKLNKLIKGGR